MHSAKIDTFENRPEKLYLPMSEVKLAVLLMGNGIMPGSKDWKDYERAKRIISVYSDSQETFEFFQQFVKDYLEL